MNTDKEMKLLKYRMICCLAAALLGIGGLVCFSGSQRPQGDDKALVPSLSANYPIDLSENISLPVLSINEAPLPPDGQDSAADDSYLQDAPSYTDTKDDEVPVMTASDRYTYEEGFFYQSLTDDIKARINGLSYKSDCTVPYEDLRYVSVLYEDFNGETQTGEIICNKAIAQDLVEIFYELYEADYPIERICLVDEYQGDDESSMRDNNTSCFNYRALPSGRLSNHAYGLAIDLNPFYNPYVITRKDGTTGITPAGSEPYADRTQDFAYKIDKEDPAYRLFTEHGFTWGGSWRSSKDYQHFEKAI